ncbi:MAG: hypothetical protein CM15mP111_3150 [Hyphomicrobiales bacterium]|nr:MAG: hypothetical protein CM15mP111_3150 [Hyphomicrobiales bacterium]
MRCKNNYYIPLAAGVEFMHTATLLHDDVVDDSEMRRGKIAARMLWETRQACSLVIIYWARHLR